MARCLFCKSDTAGSRSVEHIVPESLGNVNHVLPCGVVCDKCNNYFAVKVEKPFLESPDIVALRHHQAVPNKRRVIPALDVVMGPGVRARLCCEPGSAPIPYIEISSDDWGKVMSSGSRSMWVRASSDEWPESVVSRFLAKAAVEALAERLIEYPENLDSLVDEPALDSIRRYARYGEGVQWPYVSRRIYDASLLWRLEDGSVVQNVCESDLLYTDDGELYYVVAFFGLEFSINLGAPLTVGYHDWLAKNGNNSPLYYGNNQSARINGTPFCGTCRRVYSSLTDNCSCRAV